MRTGTSLSEGRCPTEETIRLWAMALACSIALAQEPAAAESPAYSVVERDQNRAVYRKVTLEPGPTGSMLPHTNQFTLLENNLHYLEQGVWKESEDVIESFPEGAVDLLLKLLE